MFNIVLSLLESVYRKEIQSLRLVIDTKKNIFNNLFFNLNYYFFHRREWLIIIIKIGIRVHTYNADSVNR